MVVVVVVVVEDDASPTFPTSTIISPHLFLGLCHQRTSLASLAQVLPPPPLFFFFSRLTGLAAPTNQLTDGHSWLRRVSKTG